MTQRRPAVACFIRCYGDRCTNFSIQPGKVLGGSSSSMGMPLTVVPFVLGQGWTKVDTDYGPAYFCGACSEENQ